MNIAWHQGGVVVSERERLLGHRPLTVWFTGLSGSGKSTLAFALEQYLIRDGYVASVLDGDNLRHGLNADLGFEDAARTENIRRVAEVAKLFNSAGLITLCAFISPTVYDRALAKEIVGKDNFFEIYVSTPLQQCEQRDPKGLYRKARNGLLERFTGIDAPYESPLAPDLAIDTSRMDSEHCIQLLYAAIQPRIILD